MPSLKEKLIEFIRDYRRDYLDEAQKDRLEDDIKFSEGLENEELMLQNLQKQNEGLYELKGVTNDIVQKIDEYFRLQEQKEKAKENINNLIEKFQEHEEEVDLLEEKLESLIRR
jgi:seryl-tRNA synthetase